MQFRGNMPAHAPDMQHTVRIRRGTGDDISVFGADSRKKTAVIVGELKYALRVVVQNMSVPQNAGTFEHDADLDILLADGVE